MKDLGNVLWGIVLVVLGLVFGLNALDITDINIFFDGWWTLFIIVPCFIGLIKENDKTGNLIGLLFGVALLLCCQGLLNFDIMWKLTFPVILVIVGLSLIFKNFFHKKVNEEIEKLNKKIKKDDSYCATFSGINVSFADEEFNGTDLTAVFGGIKCDLRNATIKEDVVINASCIFGGIDILVPDDVKVKVKSNSLFGGVEEKQKNRKEQNGKYTIYINASCIFGGVEVK